MLFVHIRVSADRIAISPPKIGGLGAQWVLVLSPHQNVVSSAKKKSVLSKVFSLEKVFSPNCSSF